MIIQSLEGSRRSWVISKRYTDFVNLHEALTPYFRIQISIGKNKKAVVADKQKNISRTEQILPVLPSKISGQTTSELSQRQQELETYMCQVFAIMSGQAQFNRALMVFIGFVPDPNQKQLDDSNQISPKFFDILRYQINPNLCQASIRNHSIRLDENQKPKSFYFVDINFKLLKIVNSQSKQNVAVEMEQNDKIVLEKVYGDFKRLHAHILETF